MKNAFTAVAAVTISGRNTGKGNIMKTSPGLLTWMGVVAVSILAALGVVSCRQVTGGEPVDPVPVERTHEVSMRDGELVFDIVFTGLEDADLPEYVEDLAYRLDTIGRATGAANAGSVNNLISQKIAHEIERFIIEIEYTEGSEAEGFRWDFETRTFKISNSLISTTAPNNAALRDAFTDAAVDLYHNPPAAAMLDDATMRLIENVDAGVPVIKTA